MLTLKSSIEAQESRIALGMLAPALIIVLSIVLFPVALNFWVSLKPVRLGDLRPPTPLVRERVQRGDDARTVFVRYQIRNSSSDHPIEEIVIFDTLPDGFVSVEVPEGFSATNGSLVGDIGTLDGGEAVRFDVVLRGQGGGGQRWEEAFLATEPRVQSQSENILTNFSFTLDNYRFALSSREIVPALFSTVLYALCGSLGALFFGMCAALLVNRTFFGRGVVRGLLLFSYVAPIVAVTFVWRFLLDPISGTINELLILAGVVDAPISFLSDRPTALLSVIFFDMWRYFPFCYLFILARLKAIPNAFYESAEIDGAGVLRSFWSITLPQIRTIMATMFLLRFIWTFNRFDDIFLLTGGAAGTLTLPIQVYDYAFGASEIGVGSATSVMLFLILALFLFVFTHVNRRKEID